MCLLIFSLGTDRSVVLVANRDESYDRPTAALSFWTDAPEIVAGRDLRAGGTWLGMTRSGRIAAVTNVRGARLANAGGQSRGELPLQFLKSQATPQQFLDDLQTRADHYPGFNLIVGTRESFAYFSNAGNLRHDLAPGLYGLSNARLDTPWPKVEQGKERLATALARGAVHAANLCELLHDRSTAPDGALPDTGVGLPLERALSASFIVTPNYGTRSTTALVMNAHGKVDLYEKSYGPDGVPLTEVGQRFELE